jgi:predicted ribosomally synthesized peptide with SipW-like signal peptide
MAIVLVIGLLGAGTLAYFSDTASSSANSFTSGTLSIDDSGLSSAVAFNLPNMAPGDVTGDYTVTIRNNGNLNLAWLGDWQFTGNSTLMDALYIDYARMDFLTPTDANWQAQGSDNFITSGVGSGLYASAFNPLVAPSPINVITFNNWNNNTLMVPGSVYEHAGALRPNYAYLLTIRFGLASGADNTYQNLGPVTASLKVDATQIVAAPIVALTGGWNDIAWLNAQIADQTEP